MNAPSSLVSPLAQEIDSLEPLTLRPQLLQDFIGQSALKDNLKVFIDAACIRRLPLDHVLFYGPPGLGKTTLSQIVARELGVSIKITAGPMITKGGDLAALLTNLKPLDVLFIDEIHRLPTAVEEVLYAAMEDYKLDLIIGEGPSARSIRIDLPPFTLIGATTRAGLLSTPLRDRFGIPLPLTFYTPEELSLVLRRGADALSIGLDTTGAYEIAQRSRGTPRIALRLLKRVADFALMHDYPIIDSVFASTSLFRLDVDGQGLDALDRKYLQTMVDFYQGGPVGVDTLCAVLSEQRDTLEDVVEPYLLQQGFILRTPRGRMLGALGWSHLNLTPPASFASLFDGAPS